MTTSPTTDRRSPDLLPPAGTAGWLALAAAPTFAVMALVEVTHARPPALCAPVAGLLPIDGMTAMYLLMSVFHLPPWLKLAAGRPAASPGPTPEGDEA
ncbi:hypothetical protein [Methylobrevis albus]|uniref:Uncharacterized protein n=1 Tax=Methylobrevis albus TaxID=2793297 RepID=A0A931MX70_9HYPH|nr:hypothetical protein [Methylobrevis albus]MBH0236380.1 hypothetical protein [Methylobrevis albus]